MSTPVIEKTGTVIHETIEEFLEQSSEQEDLSKKAHVITPGMNARLWAFLGLEEVGGVEGTQMLVDYARANQIAIVALCKYVWVPTEKVGNHEVCGACMAIASNWITEDGS